MSETFPSPDTLYPLIYDMERTCFLKNIVTQPNVIVGDYTYYDDETDVRNFEKNILYHYEFLGDKLVIGKFCQIASGVKFLMNGMFHIMDAFTTYPFTIFSKECGEKYPKNVKFPFKGDTVIGNDVWIGHNVTFMPGVRISDGAIIGTNSLVTKNVGPYEVWGGNPAHLIRKRFSDEVIDCLEKIQWWNWDIKKIAENVDVLIGKDLEKLKTLADN
ncbi:MAG: CatB-related O-acetyltransferase [Alphaproteobacteria bacterium]|nr:CatB-related O-acetyltransferase [Alphaproteobacteria bacterium]